MNQSQWTSIVAWMCDLWPHAPIEPGTATAWWPFVSHLDADQVKQAVAMCATERGRRFPPSVGDILANTAGDERDWWDAWLEVHAACKGSKSRCHTDSDDPLVVEFVKQLPEWREQVDEGSPTLRAQFRDFYRGRRDRMERGYRHQVAAGVLARLDGPELRQIGAGG